MDKRWFRTRLVSVGKTQTDIARALGIDRSGVSRILSGDRPLKVEELPLVAKVLEVSVDLLANKLNEPDVELHPTDQQHLDSVESRLERETGRRQDDIQASLLASSGLDPTQSDAAKKLAINIDHRVRRRFSPDGPAHLIARDLPVFEVSQIARDIYTIESQTRTWVGRPEQLMQSRAAFAFYVRDESMVPAFEPFDLVLVDPRMQLRPNSDCLFLSGHIDPFAQFQLRRLVEITEEAWKVVRYNPRKRLELPKKSWPLAFPIVGKFNHS